MQEEKIKKALLLITECLYVNDVELKIGIDAMLTLIVSSFAKDEDKEEFARLMEGFFKKSPGELK